MSAPKKVWVDSTSLVARDRNMYECDTAYVRADLVDGLVEALELALSCNGVTLLSDPPKDAWKYHQVEAKARAAMKALEESNGN